MPFTLMQLGRDDRCAVCTAPTAQSSRAWWDDVRNEVTCTRCRPVDFEPVTEDMPRSLPALQSVEAGVAGASGAAMFERSAANHRRRNGLAEGAELPGYITAWDTGSSVERALGQFLDDHFAGTAVVLHDRNVVNGSKRANIDHLIIASSGIWVVDATSYGGSVDVRTEGPWKWKSSVLYVNRRKQRGLLDAMGWQEAAVHSLLEPMGMGAVPIHPALCFVQTEWSRGSQAAVIDGVLVLSPDKLCSVASQPGWVQPDAINAIATQLSSGLPAATARR